MFNLDWETRSLKLLKDSEKPPEQQKKSKNKIDESVKDPILENPLYKILNEKYKSQVNLFLYENQSMKINYYIEFFSRLIN